MQVTSQQFSASKNSYNSGEIVPNPFTRSYNNYESHNFQTVYSGRQEDYQTSNFYNNLIQSDVSLREKISVSPQRQTTYERVEIQISQTSTGVRDRIIQTYKDEIKNNGVRNREYRNLENIINELQRRITRIESEITDQRTSCENQITSQSKVKTHLQQDLEQLKQTVSERELESLKISEIIQTVMKQIDEKQREIVMVRQDLEGFKEKNQSLKVMISQDNEEIIREKEVKARNQKELYDLRTSIRNKDQEIMELKRDIQKYESQTRGSLSQTAIINEQIEKKDEILEKANFRISQLEKEAQALKKELIKVDTEIEVLEQSNQRAVEYQRNVMRSQESEASQSRDILITKRILEGRLMEAEVLLQQLQREQSNLNQSNESLMQRNTKIKSEINVLEEHASLLKLQNDQIQKELDGFVETDELIKKNLDRKSKVDYLRQEFEQTLKVSQRELIAKSPKRHLIIEKEGQSAVKISEIYVSDRKRVEELWSSDKMRLSRDSFNDRSYKSPERPTRIQ